MVGAKCDCDCGSVRRSDDVFGTAQASPLWEPLQPVANLTSRAT